MSARYREANQRIEWRSSVPEELNSKKRGEEPSTLPSSANPASRKIAPEEPEKNLTIVCEEIVTRSSCVTEVEVINAWELWDGLEEEKEEHHQEFSEEHSINSQTKDDEEEKVDYKFAVINKHLEVGKDESQAIATPPIDESLTRNNSLGKDDEVKPVLQSREASIVSMEESDMADKHEDEAGPEQVAPLKEVGEVKAPSMEFTKNMSLREWLRQGSKTKHPRFSVAQSFAFPELGFGDERDEELVFDPEMLLQFEQAMDQLNTDEEFLIEEVIEKLGQDQEKEVIKSME